MPAGRVRVRVRVRAGFRVHRLACVKACLLVKGDIRSEQMSEAHMEFTDLLGARCDIRVRVRVSVRVTVRVTARH